jgi:ferredoxin-nitrate reductase
MSHLLPGQRQITNPDHRKKMEQLWGLRPGTIHPHAGYDAVNLFDGLSRGEIRAVWIVGTNPAASMPNLPRVRAALEAAELVIVQDAYYPTETTGFGDILFPASVNLEQSGTFCNSERRVSLMEPIVPPPGDAKPDWYWCKEVAQIMGFSASMRYDSAAQIFDEFARVTAGRPNDQSALTHELLAKKGPQQWPYPALGRSSARRYEDGTFPTPTGRARFFARPWSPPEEAPDEQYPLILTTGRVSGHWHTRTKTGLVTQLNQIDPEPYLQMHPDDAGALQLRAGQRVSVKSRRGESITQLRIDPKIPRGSVFMPMHWNDLWMQSASCNEGTSDAADPISKQPTLKFCAVAVTPARPAEAIGAKTSLQTPLPTSA